MRPEEYGKSRAGRCSRGRAPSTTSVFLFNHEGVFSKFPQVPRFPAVLACSSPMDARMRRILARAAGVDEATVDAELFASNLPAERNSSSYSGDDSSTTSSGADANSTESAVEALAAAAPAPPAPSGGIWVGHRGDLPWSPTASPKSSPNLMRKSSSSSAGQFVPSPVAARRAIERARSFSTR